MKKITSVLVVLIAVVAGHSAYTGNVISKYGTNLPLATNNFVATIGDGTAQNDSLAIAGSNVWGPMKLCKDAASPQAKGFQTFAPSGVIDSGDSIQLLYKIVPSNNLADTNGVAWTVIDTIASTGKRSSYIDLSSLVGATVFIRVTNLDATAVRLRKKISVVFTAPATVTSEAKQ